MVYVVDERILAVHGEVKAIIAANDGGLSRAAAQAAARLAAIEAPVPEDVRAWEGFRVLTGDLRVLLGVLDAAGLASSEPPGLRQLVLACLRYLYLDERTDTGFSLADLVHNRWHGELGSEHPDYIAAEERLAAYLYAWGSAETALSLFEQALDRRSVIFGDDHPDTLNTAADLCACLSKLGKHAQATELGAETMRLSSRVLGWDADVTLHAVSAFADALLGSDYTSAALAAYRDVHTGYLRLRGPDHILTLLAAETLAKVLHQTAEHEAAEALNRDLRERYMTHFGRPDERIDRVQRALDANLRALGRSDDDPFNPLWQKFFL